MATIIKQGESDYQPHPGRTDGWKLLTDMARQKKGINPQYLNFDMRELPPYQYNAAYHFHRYADELFMILSGSATLRTPDGLTEITKGDIIFFEAGEAGAHQLYNHSDGTQDIINNSYAFSRVLLGKNLLNVFYSCANYRYFCSRINKS